MLVPSSTLIGAGRVWDPIENRLQDLKRPVAICYSFGVSFTLHITVIFRPIKLKVML